MLASVVLGLSAAVVLSTRYAGSQPTAKALVSLQSTTPGAQQIGHGHISGTFIAGQFQGGGSSLIGLNASSLASGTLADARLSSNVALLAAPQTFSGAKTCSTAPSFTGAGVPFSVSSSTLVPNLNADRLDGLDSTAFLQSIPVPLALSGNTPAAVISASNNSVSPGSAGVAGVSYGATGITYGGYFQSDSNAGRGVTGWASSASGATFGGWFRSDSNGGFGVYAEATSTAGTNFGVLGKSSGPAGVG
ncbi:MAG TPA: hypothetical protein PLL78_01015 [Fimbriimonadaceae bacterium]|nr:hypothetical protein [Fimbriimonadaceae bacterium]HRJ95243.1 hypothetical protein [Fimbriimonadaceae bacterium]